MLRAPEQGPARGWAWTDGDKPTVAKRLKLAKKQTSKGPLYRVRTMTDAGSWTLTAKRLIFRDAPLEQYGLLGALLGSLLGNPVTYTYRATLREKGAVHQGIMEVAFPGGE